MSVLRAYWRRVADVPAPIVFCLYLTALLLASVHLYLSPIYDMDFVQYMGNALLMEERDPVRLHQRVYLELRQRVPRPALEDLLGNEIGVSEDQNQSRQERATNAYRYAEFLPLFAIRPLYNQLLYVTSKTGLGLIRAGILISIASYFLIGVLLFVWLRAYTTPLQSLILSLLCMLSPPFTATGRDLTSDALASLVAFASLYLIFERRAMAPGILALLASIYFRTDFVVLAAPVILALWLERRLSLWQAAVLSGVGVASVLCINHFAGDYGIGMLYYRNFTGTPIAPAEMAVKLSLHDYTSAARSGVTRVMMSFFVPFLLIGAIGQRGRQFMALFWVTLAYVALHYLILPNWQERWVVIFYLAAVVCAAMPRLHEERAMST